MFKENSNKITWSKSKIPKNEDQKGLKKKSEIKWDSRNKAQY